MYKIENKNRSITNLSLSLLLRHLNLLLAPCPHKPLALPIARPLNNTLILQILELGLDNLGELFIGHFDLPHIAAPNGPKLSPIQGQDQDVV